MRRPALILLLQAVLHAAAVPVFAAQPIKLQAASLHPNLEGRTAQPLRYRPEGADFVIENGAEFFNRPLYGGNTAFRVDGGDRPEFSLYLPGRGGNLRLGLRTPGGVTWLHAAHKIVARYRPGEMHYEISDSLLGPRGRIKLIAVAFAATEGLGLEVRGEHLPRGTELLVAFGAGNGERGRRDGDIGTESVAIGDYFQFSPDFAKDTRIDFVDDGFNAVGKHATIGATASPAMRWRRVAADRWQDLAGMLAAPEGAGANVAFGRVALDGKPVYLALQVTARGEIAEHEVYREVGATSKAGNRRPLPPRFAPGELAQRFADARRHFEALRNRVRIDTPDPYLNAAMGALNVAADAVWDEEQGAIMHGAIAWRTKLLGWRGPYAFDALGWHDRARQNLDEWIPRQDISPIPDRAPSGDEQWNLARNEAGLHSNGDLSKSHYDMNLVFIDALLRHLLWTGDKAYAQAVWPMLERHLAWERRLFRREFGLDRLPLYDAYAAIWASDDLYYNGGGVTHTSAYNAWHNDMAARIARLIGKDAAPYQAEADAIKRAMRQQLWMPERGAFAEYRDLLGGQQLHPSYALWSFYHTIDSQVPTPYEATRMASDLDRQRRRIPVHGPGVPADRPYGLLATTDWMPYSWSINNVVMGENLHTALAYWQAGRSERAFELTKSALLASLFMGISPGNIGTMNYLDVYRREAQRDFADGSGVMSRVLVEGLFGVRPDALADVLALRPGLPADWDHASLRHPDVSVAYRRSGARESWTVEQSGQRFRHLQLELPARRAKVVAVRVGGKPVRWTASADAVGAPRMHIELDFARRLEVEVIWDGAALDEKSAVAERNPDHEGFLRYRQGDFVWSQLATQPQPLPQAALTCTPQPPAWTAGAPVRSRHIDLTSAFNDRVTGIFKPAKYQSPRAPHVTLALPAQGAGAWAGHVNEMPRIDDAGLRALGGTLTLPNGLTLATPSARDSANTIFTSQWDNYPHEVTLPLDGQAGRAFLLMAGSTNYMQSRIDNGEVVATYTDGTQVRMALRNPDNWWPIEQDYFADDFQFPLCGQLPVRVDLKTAQVHVPDPGAFKGAGRGRIDGGAATVLELPLDRTRTLKSLTVRTIANDVMIGLMAVTLD